MNSTEVNHNSIILHRQIPTIAYTVQNILIAIASLVAAMWSLLFTTFVFLPLALIKLVLPMNFFGTSNRARGGSGGPGGKRKVVLIVCASRGIGFNVLKHYIDEPDTLIIAASRSTDSLRKAVIELGDTRATVQCAEVDLTMSPKQLADTIRSLDKQHGPITHLYEVSGIWNYVNDSTPWGLDVTEDMIGVNVSGTVASVLAMYELMKERQYGKICIVGSVAALYNPANMISYASIKAFINTFSTSLRVLAAPCGVEVVTVHPGFIDTNMTQQMRGGDSSITIPGTEYASADGMAKKMKDAVEGGGVGVVSWPVRQSIMMYALKGLNPICDELGRWVSMKMGMSGKKVT